MPDTSRPNLLFITSDQQRADCFGFEAEITAKDANGSQVAKVKFDVDIDPWVYNIGIAYRF